MTYLWDYYKGDDKMYNQINPIMVNGCCIAKTLPLAFDESLSYLEMLCAILERLNETIKQTNANTDFISKWDESLTDIEKRLTDVENAYEENKKELTEYVEQEFLKAYNELTTMFNNYVTQISSYIAINNVVIKQYVDEKDNELKELIDNIIIGDIKLYNPTNGLTESIQKVIIDIYNVLRVYGITAQEFDVTALTASEFDALNISAFEFDNNAKLYIGNLNKYINLATGKYEPLQSIINTLFSYHQENVTALTFDGLELTATDFDEKELTAYTFDFTNSVML